MRYLLILLLTLNTSLACDWKTITKVGDKYLYTKDCHIAVGNIVKANKKLLSSIKLKDLALDTADTRITNWRNESYNQHERLQKQYKYNKTSEILYFSLGIIFTSLAVYGAGQLK